MATTSEAANWCIANPGEKVVDHNNARYLIYESGSTDGLVSYFDGPPFPCTILGKFDPLKVALVLGESQSWSIPMPYKSDLSDIVRVTNQIPAGDWFGVWSGYEVRFDAHDGSYRAKTQIGIRGTTKCKVSVGWGSNAKIKVEVVEDGAG